MKVLVTGASSQIGRFLLPRLAATGHDIVALSRHARVSDAGDSCTWMVADIERSRGMRCPPSEVLIHLAPLVLLPTILPAFLGAGVRRVICIGTTSRHSKAASSNEAEQDYADNQAYAEKWVAQDCEAAGARWTLFRPTLIYGCGMDRNVSLIAASIRRYGFFPLLGGATGLRQPVHADDLAAACVAAIGNATTFDRSYDLAGGETITYRQMVERIFAALGRRPRFVPVPLPLFRMVLTAVSLLPRYRDFNGEMARRMNQDLVFDYSAAARDLGYQPRPFQPEFLRGPDA